MDLLTAIVRALAFASALLACGLPAFALVGLGRDGRRKPDLVRFRLLTRVAAIVALLATLAGLMLLAANMSGVGLAEVDRETLSLILNETAVGTASVVRLCALALLLAASFVRPPLAALALTALSGAIAAITLAWGGHAAMNEGIKGWLHLSADGLHLLAAALWLGAIVGLLCLVRRTAATMDQPELARAGAALARFSSIGTAVVATLVVTGAINLWMIVGLDGLPSLLDRSYGRQLALKLLFFAMMLALAATNRFWFAPRLGRPTQPPRLLPMLQISLATELALLLVILLVVGRLGMTEP